MQKATQFNCYNKNLIKSQNRKYDVGVLGGNKFSEGKQKTEKEELVKLCNSSMVGIGLGSSVQVCFLSHLNESAKRPLAFVLKLTKDHNTMPIIMSEQDGDDVLEFLEELLNADPKENPRYHYLANSLGCCTTQIEIFVDQIEELSKAILELI